MKYVIEERNGNPAVLMQTPQGTYKTIAFGAGEDNLQNIVELVNQANANPAA